MVFRRVLVRTAVWHERPIRIPSRYSYDDRGSELYEARIRQPEYYQLSLEKTLLAIAGHDLQSFSIDTICELGAGSALKASMLIKRSDEHTSELQSLMRISYAVFCLKKKLTSTPKPKQN